MSLETLPRARSFSSTTREDLLAGQPFRAEDVEIPTGAGPLTLCVFKPKRPQAAMPGIYWIHGGGIVEGNRFGAIDALELAQATGAVVISPEYRLAPEHPAPAHLDDCHAGFSWFADHAKELGVDPSCLILAGGSAGGCLAAGTALRLRDEGGTPLAGLMLLSPKLDDRMTTVSSRQFTYGVPWTRISSEFGWRSLLGDRTGGDYVSIYEAPGRAEGLAGLPPAFIDVGSADLFRDEDVAFASRIWACGGNAELHVWPGGYHGFERMAPDSVLSVTAREARKNWLGCLLAATQA